MSNENQRNTATITLPTIPRQVAEAIERIRTQHPDLCDVIELALDAQEGYPHTPPEFRVIPFDTLMSALVNGYTVEKSAEELEREAHNAIRESFDYHTTGFTDDGDDAYVDGMLDTLNTLGIKIEGVNA
ncbi:hypothetical protein [Paenibacillus dakarensis]|uniref:hypothetical protein n=1 Tax=Paenibacillus dakarensis TaxID=1527293 RepID=UPI0006D531BB|nr:hypothetical protein [Paenibacillus dakarensis]